MFFLYSNSQKLKILKKSQLKKSKNQSIPTVRIVNTKLLNGNYFKALKPSFLSQVFNVDSKKDILNLKSILESKINLDDIKNENFVINFLPTDAKDSWKKAKKDK